MTFPAHKTSLPPMRIHLPSGSGGEAPQAQEAREVRMHMPADVADAMRRPWEEPDTEVCAGLPTSLSGHGMAFAGVALRVLVGFGLLMGMTDAKDHHRVQKVVKAFVEHGGKMLMAGELHYQPENLDLVTRMAQGALEANAGRVEIWLEEPYPPGDAQNEKNLLKALAQRKYRDDVIKFCFQQYPTNSSFVQTTFPTVARHQDLEFDNMNWFGTNRKDASRALNNKAITILKIGSAHVWDESVGVGHTHARTPWLNNLPTLIAQGDPRFAALSVAERKDLWNLLERSVNVNLVKTMALFSDRHFSQFGAVAAPAKVRDAFIEYYNRKGYAVLQIPFAKGMNAMAVVQPEFLAHMQALGAQDPAIQIFCDGVPGCEPAKAPGIAQSQVTGDVKVPRDGKLPLIRDL